MNDALNKANALLLNFDPFPEIITSRLVLRKIRDADVNEIFVLRSDPRVIKYLCRKPANLEQAITFIQKIYVQEKNAESITWAISYKENPLLIGTICLWNISKENHRAEIGIALHPDHQGMGIMHEAAVEVLKYGFRVMKLHSVEGRITPGNDASIKVLERHNFNREGYFKEDTFYDGNYYDTVVYSLIAPGFREAVIGDIPELHKLRMSVKENALRNPLYVTEQDYIPFLTVKGRGWVCESGGEILGFSIIDTEHNNIWALFVSPAHEARGIGKKLQQLMLEWHFSVSNNTLWLGTSPGTRAERFYELTGWKRAGKLENGEVKFEISKEDYNS